MTKLEMRESHTVWSRVGIYLGTPQKGPESRAVKLIDNWFGTRAAIVFLQGDKRVPLDLYLVGLDGAPGSFALS